MALPRLDISGMDFTVTKWNNTVDSLESVGTVILGRCVLSGMNLSAGTGLAVNVSSGMISSRSVVVLSSTSFTCPASATSYLWVDESGTITSSSSSSYPGGNVVCLGKVVTSGSSVTSIYTDNRDTLERSLKDCQQTGGYTAVAVSSADYTLTPSEYSCRIIEFTGTLTANINVLFSDKRGGEWTVVDSTTGAFSVTVKTRSGTGVVLTHSKTCKVWCDGTNIRRSTADV